MLGLVKRTLFITKTQKLITLLAMQFSLQRLSNITMHLIASIKTHTTISILFKGE